MSQQDNYGAILDDLSNSLTNVQKTIKQAHAALMSGCETQQQRDKIESDLRAMLAPHMGKDATMDDFIKEIWNV